MFIDDYTFENSGSAVYQLKVLPRLLAFYLHTHHPLPITMFRYHYLATHVQPQQGSLCAGWIMRAWKFLGTGANLVPGHTDSPIAMCGKMINLTWLVVWTPLKKMTSSVGMMTFPIYGKIENVPNHQPNNVVKTIMNHPIFDGLYHPFMEMLGLVYDCFNMF